MSTMSPGPIPLDSLVDVHAHFLPPWYVDEALEAGHEVPDGMPSWPHWDAHSHLRMMDERGIGRALLSLSSPGVTLGPTTDLARLAHRTNDYGARLTELWPDRFGLLASLPLPDVPAALAELDRAHDKLGAAGVVLPTHAGGTYLTDPALEPVWAALADRECVVLLHPTAPVGSERTGFGLPLPMAEFLFDSTRVILGLALAGTLSRHPGLRLVVPHSGSLVPFLVDRVALFQVAMRMGLSPDDPEHSIPGIVEALGGVWWDLAGTPTSTHVRALLDAFGPERLLYGSDFCFTPPMAVDLQIGLLDEVWAGLDDGPAPWRALTSANATRLETRPTSKQGRACV